MISPISKSVALKGHGETSAGRPPTLNVERSNFMSGKREHDDEHSADKPSVTLPGTVEKIIPAIHADAPEKAQISVEGADDLYRELRVENILEDDNGKKVRLKKGAHVDVTIEAEPEATQPRNS
jgi:hypothetical protein